MEEIWKDIEGYEGLYQVSNLGRIKSLERIVKGQHFEEKIMKLQNNKWGYKFICLSKNGKRKYPMVHRLVAKAFIANPDNLPFVGHLDDIPSKENNTIGNLYWTTTKENNGTLNRRKRVSNSLKGRKLSKEHINNLRKNHTNVSRGNNVNAKIVICDGKEFKCIRDCAEYYNINYSTFKSWLNGSNQMNSNFKKLNLRYKEK